MTILYNPDLGEDSLDDEALRWYKQIVHDFNDWGSHYDLMVAKIHLGDLYCWDKYGIAEAQKATNLCLEVIEVPEEEIVFDDPDYAGFNMDNIVNAKAPGRFARSDGQLAEPPESANQKHRQFLLKQRKEETDRLRRAAIRALTYKQHIPGFPPEVKLKRLLLLKQERPDDQLYQETLEAMIQDFIESHKGLKSDFDAVLEKGIEGGNVP